MDDEQDRELPVATAFGAGPGETQAIPKAHGASLRADATLGK